MGLENKNNTQMEEKMNEEIKTTKEQFDLLSSDVNHFTLFFACPNCGKYTTEPTPGCRCRIEVGKHIMKYHHTCSQ